MVAIERHELFRQYILSIMYAVAYKYNFRGLIKLKDFGTNTYEMIELLRGHTSNASESSAGNMVHYWTRGGWREFGICGILDTAEQICTQRAHNTKPTWEPRS